MAAIQAVKKPWRTGNDRTGELVRVMNWMRKRQGQGRAGKSENGLGKGTRGNERADGRAKFYIRMVGPEVLTERGIKQQVRKEERVQVGWGQRESSEVGKKGVHQGHSLPDRQRQSQGRAL